MDVKATAKGTFQGVEKTDAGLGCLFCFSYTLRYKVLVYICCDPKHVTCLRFHLRASKVHLFNLTNSLSIFYIKKETLNSTSLLELIIKLSQGIMFLYCDSS